jgi:signal peptidase I
MGMRTVRFVELALLVICVLLGTSGSVDVLSDNYIIRDGHTIHQLLASIDSNSMSPDLTLGDWITLSPHITDSSQAVGV